MIHMLQRASISYIRGWSYANFAKQAIFSILRYGSISDHFKSIEEAAEFWDKHDLADYWDLTREAHFKVDIKQRLFLVALEAELAKKLAACARKQGVTTETLINRIQILRLLFKTKKS